MIGDKLAPEPGDLLHPGGGTDARHGPLLRDSTAQLLRPSPPRRGLDERAPVRARRRERPARGAEDLRRDAHALRGRRRLRGRSDRDVHRLLRHPAQSHRHRDLRDGRVARDPGSERLRRRGRPPHPRRHRAPRGDDAGRARHGCWAGHRRRRPRGRDPHQPPAPRQRGAGLARARDDDRVPALVRQRRPRHARDDVRASRASPHGHRGGPL